MLTSSQKRTVCFYSKKQVWLQIPTLPLKIKGVSLLWQLKPPAMLHLTPGNNKKKGLNFKFSYFTVSIWTLLLFELVSLEGHKLWTAFREGGRHLVKCLYKGCEPGGRGRARFKACLTNELKLSGKGSCNQAKGRAASSAGWATVTFTIEADEAPDSVPTGENPFSY